MDKGNIWESVTLKIWYGGSFTKNESGFGYTGRLFRTAAVERDEFCWFTLLEECEKCGTFKRNVDAIFFMNPDVGLERVVDDSGAQVMCKLAVKERVVECYIVSAVDVAHLLHLINFGEGEGRTIVKCSRKLTPRRKGDTKKVDEKIPLPNQGPPLINEPIENSRKTRKKSKNISHTTIKETLIESSSKATEKKSQVSTIDQTTSKPSLQITSPNNLNHTTVEPYYDFNDLRVSDLFEKYEEEADLAGLNANDADWEDLSDGQESEDPGYNPDEESLTDNDDSEVELVDEAEIENEDLDEENFIEQQYESDGLSGDEETREARQKVREWNAKTIKFAKQLQIEASSTQLPEQETEVASEKQADKDGNVSDYDNSGDEIDTPGESDDDPIPGKRRRSSIPEVNEKTDFSKFKWSVGIRFPTRDVFRDCVARYAITQGRNLTFIVSDKNRGRRLGVRCKQGCPFKLYGSWDNKLACFIVKTVIPAHSCQRTMESNTQLKSTWVAKQLLDVFKARPHWPAADIIDTVRRAYKVIIKKDFAYKVKYTAHKLLHGSMRDHYSKLGSYLKALEQEYPSSVFTLTTNPNVVSSVPVFQRLFVCFEALKQGWLEGCRKILCVDACFLKTFLGGQLISAVGRDGNDQMFPLAWGVVEGENNESYEWFFKELKKAVGEVDGDGWTIISDEHQSIITMVAKEFPKAEHRRCARHIFSNWHKSYKGEEMKLLFWNCAKAYNQADFDEAVAAMREVDSRAADAFLACNPTLFCRAFIGTRTTNDVIVNNMAETFNAFIINARSKHLIYMLEDIRTMLMQRLVKKRMEMEASTSIICPNIQERLEKEKEKAAYCTPLLSNVNQYQVRDGLDELKVHLMDRTCTCRKWDATGIPCCHAVAAIFEIHALAEDYVHPMYMREAYLNAYRYSINPFPGERHWPKTEQPMIPPPIKIGPGRPRKKRRRDPHEDPKKSGRLTKHGLEMTCSICKSKTHNRRKCPQKDRVVPPPPKRGRGRPRLLNVETREEQASTSQLHHEATAQPSRTGRSGRVIRAGRGAARGANTGGARGGRRRRGSGRAPQGLGVLIDDQGYAFTNVPGSHRGPRSILSAPGSSSQGNTQVSTTLQPT